MSCVVAMAVTLGGMAEASAETALAIVMSNVRPDPEISDPEISAGSVQQQGIKNLDATIGVCMPIPSPVVIPESAEYQISPESAAATYFKRVENIRLYQYLDSATVTVVQQPKHGKLIGDSGSRYYPAAGYTGNDSITYLVELGGKRVKMVYFLQVVGQGAGNQNYYQGAGSNQDICPKSKLFPWKISSIPDANGNPASATTFGNQKGDKFIYPKTARCIST